MRRTVGPCAASVIRLTCPLRAAYRGPPGRPARSRYRIPQLLGRFCREQLHWLDKRVANNKTQLSPRSVLPMHIFSAIACHRTALHRVNAMITQVGFHDMPSAVWRQGRATQVVNPLSALSLLAARRSGSGLPGHAPGLVAELGILAGTRRLSGSLAAPGRRPSGRPGPAGTRVPSLPRRPCRLPVWTSGRAYVGWRGRDGAPMRQPSRHWSPVSHPVRHTVRCPMSPPQLPVSGALRLPGRARCGCPRRGRRGRARPRRAARPPRRLIPSESPGRCISGIRRRTPLGAP